MDYLSLISKLIGSSLLAIALLVILYISFSASQHLFGKQVLISYAISALTLLIFSFFGFSYITKQLNNSQLELRGFFTFEQIFSELIISVIMVVSFIGARLILKSISRLFKKEKISSEVTLTPLQQDVEQPFYGRIENEEIRKFLKTWGKQKNIRIPITTHDLLVFFAEKYWEIHSITGEKSLEACLLDCHIGIEYPPTEREFSIFDMENPDEEPKFIPLEFFESDVFITDVGKHKVHTSLIMHDREFSITANETEAIEKIKKLSELA